MSGLDSAAVWLFVGRLVILAEQTARRRHTARQRRLKRAQWCARRCHGGIGKPRAARRNGGQLAWLPR